MPAPSLTPAQIVTEAGTVAKGLSGALTQLAGADPSLIPAGTLATLQSDLTLAQGAASALSTSLPASNGAATVQTVEGYINAVLNALAAPPINGLIPAPYNLAVTAAALVVPDLEAFVNQYLPAASAVAPATHAARLQLRASRAAGHDGRSGAGDPEGVRGVMILLSGLAFLVGVAVGAVVVAAVVASRIEPVSPL